MCPDDFRTPGTDKTTPTRLCVRRCITIDKITSLGEAAIARRFLNWPGFVPPRGVQYAYTVDGASVYTRLETESLGAAAIRRADRAQGAARTSALRFVDVAVEETPSERRRRRGRRIGLCRLAMMATLYEIQFAPNFLAIRREPRSWRASPVSSSRICRIA